MSEPRDRSAGATGVEGRNEGYTTPKYVPPPQSGTPQRGAGLQHRRVLKLSEDSFLKRYQTEIAASASSGLSTFIAFPLDSVKTRMQAYKFNGFLDCINQTYINEGMKGFWRGSLAPLASVTAVRTISFSIYSNSKEFYGRILQGMFGRNCITTENSAPGSLPKLADTVRWGLGGATAGGAITFIACPFEFTKLSAQIEYLMARSRAASMDDAAAKNTVKYEAKGTAQAAQYIIKTRGYRGLYSGFHLHFARDTLGTAIYFTIYESAKQVLSSNQAVAQPVAIAAAGGLCGLLSWVLIYPVDSLKSIYQRDILTHRPGAPLPKRPLTFFNRRMYRGLGVSMTRSAMLNAVFFSSYEKLKREIEAM